jgi:hypothetical protein
MRTFDARWYLVIGFVLALLGVVLPLLMVMRILPSTYLLNFVSYAAIMGGLFLAAIGTAYYVSKNRKK